MSSRLHLSDARFLAALRRIRSLIESGVSQEAVDSTAPGNKYTHCTWGLCSKKRDAWPDAEDHLWPDLFFKEGRFAPKYTSRRQSCPLREKAGSRGCFYDCAVFQAKNGQRPPTREQALALYDAAIAKMEARLAAQDKNKDRGDAT